MVIQASYRSTSSKFEGLSETIKIEKLYKVLFKQMEKREGKVGYHLMKSRVHLTGESFGGVGFRGRQIRCGEGRIARTKGTERSPNGSPRGARSVLRPERSEECANVLTPRRIYDIRPG